MTDQHAPTTPDGAPGDADATNELAEKLGPFWSAGEVVEPLNFSDVDELKRAVARGDLLGLTTAGGALMFPTFQFAKRDGRASLYSGVRLVTSLLLGVMSRHVGRDRVTS